MKLNCKYPAIIRNPQFNQLVLNGYNLILNKGVLIHRITIANVNKILNDEYLFISQIKIFKNFERVSTDEKLPKFISYKEIINYNRDDYKRTYYINYDEIDNYIIMNQSTAECQPLFMLVRCNHCSLCNKYKVSKIKTRCLLQSVQHNQKPFFLTLTINEQNYPSNPDDIQVHTEIIQKFNKRLRKHLSLNNYNTNYKYLIVSEYGSLRGRLHFHALIFGISDDLYKPVRVDNSIYGTDYVFKFTELVHKAWQQGFIKVEEAKDETGSYVAKYIGKSSGDKRTKSYKSINFGKQTILDNVEAIRQSPELKSFELLVKNTIHDIPLYRYISDIAFPSAVRQLDITFRRTLLKVYKTLSYMLNHNQLDLQYSAIYNMFHSKYGKYLDLLNYRIDDSYDLQMYNIDDMNNIDTLLTDIDLLDEYDYDFQEVVKYDELHKQSVLVTNITEFDTDFNSYMYDKLIGTLKSRETDFQ